ncbi:MAG: hypothetical protein K9N47_21090 [Prosthecobacter sp.]|uniref:hypothetical protein n=1 Tax=Prosthecobacter sp. TaxID=1965333 RepID=UPI0026164AAF|nr:hypothetical protein [Prosthecobacter sp.]MCF7788632.1 hypothetical protein [Prosthecobacter sp.]
MKIALTCIASLLIGILGTWFFMKPEFGDAERKFYDKIVYYHAQVAAEGHYGASASTYLACQDLDKLLIELKNPVFIKRARGLAFTFRQAHEETAAKAFKAEAENFFAVYASRMQ